MEGPVEFHLEVQADPELLGVLQIELDRALGEEDIDVEPDALVQAPVDVPEVDAEDGDADPDLEGVGVDVAGDLEGPISDPRRPLDGDPPPPCP